MKLLVIFLLPIKLILFACAAVYLRFAIGQPDRKQTVDVVAPGLPRLRIASGAGYEIIGLGERLDVQAVRDALVSGSGRVQQISL